MTKRIKFRPLIILAAVIFFLLSFRQDLKNLDSIRKESEKLKEQMQSEEKRSLFLSKDINKLQRNEIIEKIAREKLGLIKQGEIPYKILYTE